MNINKIRKIGLNNCIKVLGDEEYNFFEPKCLGKGKYICRLLHYYLGDFEREENSFYISKRNLDRLTTTINVDGEDITFFTCCSFCEMEGQLFYCRAHGEYEYHKDGSVWIDGWYCRESEGENWNYCSECGQPTRSDYLFDNNLCSNCADTVEIYEYHEFDDLEFFGSPSDDMYFGLEIETAYDRNDNDYFYDDYILFRKIIKPNSIVDSISHYEEDGSISGIECVTQPMSYEFLCNNLHHITTHLDKCNFYTKNGNGLHIHISRTDFINENIHKILYFFENNRDNVIQFSGRSMAEIVDWTDFYYEDSLYHCKLALEENHSRYRCINNTNDNTIEFRLFRSELDSKLVLGAVEFIQVLVDMLKDEYDLVYVNFKDIIEYAKNKSYDNLLYRYNYYFA